MKPDRTNSDDTFRTGGFFGGGQALILDALRRVHPSPFVKDILFTTITSVLTTVSTIVVTRLLAEGLGPEKFGANLLSRRTLATGYHCVILFAGDGFGNKQIHCYRRGMNDPRKLSTDRLAVGGIPGSCGSVD